MLLREKIPGFFYFLTEFEIDPIELNRIYENSIVTRWKLRHWKLPVVFYIPNSN